MELVVERTRTRGKQKLAWLDKVEADLKVVSPQVGDAKNKVNWSSKILVPDLLYEPSHCEQATRDTSRPVVKQEKCWEKKTISILVHKVFTTKADLVHIFTKKAEVLKKSISFFSLCIGVSSLSVLKNM